MNGENLFDLHVSQGGEYSQTLLTAFSVIGNELYPILEKAEKAGKQIVLVDNPDIGESDDQPFVVKVEN